MRIVHQPITFVFSEFGTILAQGNPDPTQFPPGPYAAAGTITLLPGGKYTYKAMEMRNGVQSKAEFTETFTEDPTGNAVFLNFTWQDQPTPIAYIAFTEHLKEGRGISLIPGMSKTYLLVSD